MNETTENVTPTDPLTLAEAIAQAEATLAELKARAKQTKQDRINALVAKVRPAVEAAGVDMAAFCRALNPGKARPVLALNSDPTKTWSRGVMPDWMKAAMVAGGYDPASAENRASFRADQMTVVG